MVRTEAPDGCADHRGAIAASCGGSQWSAKKLLRTASKGEPSSPGPVLAPDPQNRERGSHFYCFQATNFVVVAAVPQQ